MRLFSLAMMLLVPAVVSYAQESEWYVSANDLPDGVKYLPAPPDTSSIFFFNDWARYTEGLKLRLTERGEQAIADADCSLKGMAQYYSEAVGVEISDSITPAIYNFLGKVRRTADNSTQSAKKYYMRRRPFMVFNQPTSTPSHEKFLVKNGSYPSGHTAIAWGMALAIVQLDPSSADEVLRLGYEFGQSRTIVGAHFQSDVDAGRLAASAAFAAMQCSEDYQSDLAEARAELEAVKAGKESPSLAKYQNKATEKKFNKKKPKRRRVIN